MIRFEGVVKRFGGRVVLGGVSFRVGAGEMVSVVGPSGTGKSVMLKHCVRLLTPTEGKVWVGGVEVSAAKGRELERVRERFGFLFQGGALMGWLTVGENVALPLRERTGLGEAEIARRVGAALEAVELGDAAERYPAEISGGMQKRAGLARAIVRDAEAILYDEPTSGLDPVTGGRINRLIRKLNRERGITSVVVTHDLQAALRYSDRVIMLKDGAVAEDAAPEEFVRSRNAGVREFLEAQYITERWFREIRREHEEER